MLRLISLDRKRGWSFVYDQTRDVYWFIQNPRLEGISWISTESTKALESKTRIGFTTYDLEFEDPTTLLHFVEVEMLGIRDSSSTVFGFELLSQAPDHVINAYLDRIEEDLTNLRNQELLAAIVALELPKYGDKQRPPTMGEKRKLY